MGIGRPFWNKFGTSDGEWFRPDATAKQGLGISRSCLREGKLVPQDPNDEPASVLLERIHAERGRRAKERKTSGKGKNKSEKKKEVANV